MSEKLENKKPLSMSEAMEQTFKELREMPSEDFFKELNEQKEGDVYTLKKATQDW